MKNVICLLLLIAGPSIAAGNVQYTGQGGGSIPSAVLLVPCTDGRTACDPSVNPLPVVMESGGVPTGPLAVITTDKSGTITLGGTAQPAILLNASRKAYCVQNPPTATEVLTVRVNGTASATTGVILSAGSQACSLPGLIDTAAVSVFAATTAHAFTAWEAQ